MPFETRLFLQQFPPPASLSTVERAAAALGLRLTRCDGFAGALGRASGSAAIAFRRARADTDARVALVLAADRNAVLVAEREGEPKSLPHDRFRDEYEPDVLLATAAPRVEREAGVPAFGFGWFVPELLRHRAVWRDVLVASLVMQVLALAVPLCTQVVIDKVVVHHAASTLMVIVAALVLFLVFNALLGYVRQYLLLHTGNRIDAVLGARVFEHLLRLPPRYFEQRPTGTIVARLHGVETVREFLTGAAASVALDLPFLLVFVAIMLWYSVPLTLIALGAITLLAALSAAFTPALRRRVNAQFLAGARNQAFVTEHVSAMETVKALQLEPQLAARYGQNLADYLEASFATRHLSNTYATLAGALEQALAVAILAAGAWLVMTSEGFTIGMLVAFQMFAARVAAPALRLAGLWQELQQASIAVQRLGDLMDAPAEPWTVRSAAPRAGPASVELQEVTFSYMRERAAVLERFSLSIAAGACVALTGPSGSGKSTLAKLLLGFHFPEAGSVKIDGRDTRHLSANELRLQFGVVPQDTRLFSGTVFDNLAIAQPHASLAEIIEACRFAEIHDFIESLPNGYQCAIGEHGAGLSGGQRQRLAIARALLRRPRVLVFDEATASLDRPTAEAIGRTVSRLRGQVTVLFIAHDVPDTLAADAVKRLEPRGFRPPMPAQP